MSFSLPRFGAGAIGLLLAMLAGDSYAQVQERLGSPNILLGKTGAAGPASIDAASINPAQAGAMKYTEVQGAWGLKSEEYTQRNPGFEAHRSPFTGLDGFPMPNFVWKPNPQLGIGGLLIPFPVKQDIDKRHIPIIILSQEDYVDLKGSGNLKALALGTIGYEVNNNFHLGAGISYLSIDGSVDLVPSSGGQSLAHVETTASFLSIKLGTKIRLNRSFTLGLVVGAYDATTTSFKVDSPLMEAGDDALTAPGDSSVTASTFLNPIRAGVAFRPQSRLVLTADVEYKRVDKTQQAFSIVDLAMKQREVADTVSAYGGGEMRVGNGTMLFGGFYEPSEIGQGSPGADGLSGFGFMDIAQNIGEPPVRPQWMIGGGYRWERGEIYPRGMKAKDKAERKPDPRMLIEAGLTYGETSIGVDNSGEQPGAYLVQRFKIPFKLIYRF